MDGLHDVDFAGPAVDKRPKCFIMLSTILLYIVKQLDTGSTM